MPERVQVWDAVQELKAEAAWKVDSIMEFATAFEAQLATGQSHDLPALQAPKQPPVDNSLSASEVTPPSSYVQRTPNFTHHNTLAVYFPGLRSLRWE